MTTSKAVHSQAFGFMSSLQGAVDPRTGQYTVAIDFPEVKSNWLGGPAFPVSLGFNPINTLDSGYGLGWNLNLTQFTPHNSILALSTGETYKVTGSGATPDIKEKKLDSFHFENLGNGRYRVLHKSGLVEVLQVGGSSDDRVALPVEIYSAAGHRITLVYASFRGGQRLQSISDAQGELLRINRPNDTLVEVLARPNDGPGGGPLARYEMNLNASGWVTSIVLPTADKASWRFAYGNGPIRGILCLHEVKTPVGGRETIDYADTGHPYPGGVSRPNLPRVTRHRSYPGFGQPMIQVDYSYTARNFLGAGASVSWEDGMDPLYKVASSYEYGSIASLMDGTTVVRQVERTFNRFHLLTEEKTTQQQCVKRIKTEYYAQDIPFEQQVAQFQLPRKVTTSWEIANDATQYRDEAALSAYDVYGNQTEQVEPNGIKTTYTYYPKEGEDGCPPDRFVRNLKDTVVTPSPDGAAGAPTLRTRLRYAAHQPLTGSGLQDWLAIESETLVQVDGSNETLLQETRRSYHELPGDAFLHGRPVTQQTTLNGKTSTTSYQYERLTSALAGETVLKTTELFVGFDGIEKAMSQQNSLITGETVLSTDLDGVELQRQFDALGRVTREIVSPSFPDVKGERIYTYSLTSADGQQASQSVTEISGVTSCTRFDGQGRVIYQDYAEKTETPRQVFAANYDALDNRVGETRYDWLEEQSIPLRQQFEYDAWGVVCRTINPDSSVSKLMWSPFGRKGPIEYSWLETAGPQSTITISNLTGGEYNDFAKFDRLEQLDAQPLIDLCRQEPARSVEEHLKRLLKDAGLPTVGVVRFHYDGKSNCVQQDELYDDIERSTHFAYDAWNRVKATTLADGTVIQREFAEQSIDQQVTRLNVKPNSAPEVTVGQQKFDSLLRLTEVSVGDPEKPRIEQYRYTGSQMQPSQRITPLQTFDYTYKPELTRQPTTIKAGEDQPATYVYDPRTGGIVKATNNQGLRAYRYTPGGQLEHESWTDTDDNTMETHYVNSLLGRQLSRSVTDGLDTVHTYDECGRVSSVTQGKLKADFEYNALGQVQRTTSRNDVTGVTLVADVQYDTQGREVERILNVSHQAPCTITQTWQGDNQLKSRHLSADGRSLLTEEFVYDQRNRLVHHKCSGAQKHLPQDAYGNSIVSQVFTFDALDNVQRVVTQFENGLSDVARFFYIDEDLPDRPNDPCQLKKITHTYTAGGYSPSQTFEYDANGHMLNDEANRRMVYDNQGRLIAVKDSTGQQTLMTYRYDGHNHLVGVRRGNESETLRFYQGYSLSHTRQDTTYIHYLFEGNRPLGQQQVDDHAQTMLLMTDGSPNVIGECLQSGVNTAVYNAYGVRSSSEGEMRSLLAFNSEVCEEVIDWYLLGRGYRAYNPNLMRFHSPDSFSPFGSGGLNPYAYCLGNPTTFRDPSGHRAAYKRPDNPGYIDPIEQPKGTSLLGKIVSVLGFVAIAAAAIAAAIFVPAAGWVFAALVIGAIITSIGAGVATYGTIADDETAFYIGSGLTILGGLISGAAFFSRGKPDNPDEPSPSPTRRGSNTSDSNDPRNPPTNERRTSLDNNVLNSQHGGSTQSSIYNPSIPELAPVPDPNITNNIVRRNSIGSSVYSFEDNRPTNSNNPPTHPISRHNSVPDIFNKSHKVDGKWVVNLPNKIFTTDGPTRK